MNEDFATRAWADNHAQMSQGIDNAVRTIVKSLKVLRDKQYSAPWRDPAPCADCISH